MEETLKTLKNIALAIGALKHPIWAAVVVGFVAYLLLIFLARYTPVSDGSTKDSFPSISTGPATAIGSGAVANSGPNSTINSHDETSQKTGKDKH